MNPRNQWLGRFGERLAEQHLLAQGARLLERNYRRDYGEVDLLLEHEGDFVAVEVKTRDLTDLQHPEEAVTWSQLRRIVRAMSTYAMDNDLLEWTWRVDVVLVSIDPNGSVHHLDHLRGVYPA